MATNKKGFTFIELIVVIAVMAIMAGAVSVGFNSFSHTVSVQNVPGYIGDILNELGQEAILKEYKKSSVYFESEYLVVDSVDANAGLSLMPPDEDCVAGYVNLKSSFEAMLFVRDAVGETLGNPVQMTQDKKLCVDPLEHEIREVIYELQTDTGSSNKIRIFPLNLGLDGSNNVYLESNEYRLDISWPYGQKKRFDGVDPLYEDTEAVIIVRSKEGEASTTFNLPKK